MNEINEDGIRQLDWTLPTRKLHAQTGLPKRTLSMWRKKLGVGRATQYAPQDAPSMRKMKLSPDEIDWSKPRRVIAAECGVSLQRISQLHKRKFGLVRKSANSGTDCPDCGSVKSVAKHNADLNCHKCGFTDVVDEDRKFEGENLQTEATAAA